jgi:hypothetical protein
MHQKATNNVMTLCFPFLQISFNCFFVSKMNDEESLMETLQRQSKESL